MTLYNKEDLHALSVQPWCSSSVSLKTWEQVLSILLTPVQGGEKTNAPAGVVSWGKAANALRLFFLFRSPLDSIVPAHSRKSSLGYSGSRFRCQGLLHSPSHTDPKTMISSYLDILRPHMKCTFTQINKFILYWNKVMFFPNMLLLRKYDHTYFITKWLFSVCPLITNYLFYRDQKKNLIFWIFHIGIHLSCFFLRGFMSVLQIRVGTRKA